MQDALLACSEAAKLFIHYLASTASDNCKDAKRQTISAGACRALLCWMCGEEVVKRSKRASFVLPPCFCSWPADPQHKQPTACLICCHFRATCSADDVATALEDLDFGELVAPLRAALEGGLLLLGSHMDGRGAAYLTAPQSGGGLHKA